MIAEGWKDFLLCMGCIAILVGAAVWMRLRWRDEA